MVSNSIDSLIGIMKLFSDQIMMHDASDEWLFSQQVSQENGEQMTTTDSPTLLFSYGINSCHPLAIAKANKTVPCYSISS